jgi:hypothetical protein
MKLRAILGSSAGIFLFAAVASAEGFYKARAIASESQ